jgi:hypothetical protein
MARQDKLNEADQTTLGRRVFNYQYQMRGRDLRGWTLVKAVHIQQVTDAAETVYVWQAKDPADHALVRVEITERHTWRQAQRQLSETLTHCMRPAIPRGTGPLSSIGDVNFSSRDPESDAPAAILFARGNVCVSVNSVGDVAVDVSVVADSIDRALTKVAAKSDVDKRRRPARAPASVVAKTKQRVVLIETLSESVPEGAWLKVVAPDGELTRKADALIYSPAEGGNKRIIYAMREG